MQKIILSILTAASATAFALAALAPDPTDALPDYSLSIDGSAAPTNSDRYTSSVTVTSPLWGVQTATTNQTAARQGTVFNDLTATTTFKAAPGECVNVSLAYHGGWLMGYVYLDKDNNGFDWTTPQSSENHAELAQNILNGDLMGFTVWDYTGNNNFIDRDGNNASMVSNYNGNMPLSFAIPEDMAEGVYRIRFVVGWQGPGPRVNSQIIEHGGIVIDANLRVMDDPYKDSYPVAFDRTTLRNTRTADAQQPRYVNSLTLLGSSHGNQTLAINQRDNTLVYHYKSNDHWLVKAGETVSINPDWSMNAMHSFIYVDLDNNGIFDLPETIVNGQPNGDMLSYSFLSGCDKNSAGVTVSTPAGHVDNRIAPAFTIPADTPKGMYRLRYKIDWATANPGGRDNMGGDGGIIVDVPLIVTDDNATPVVTVEGNPQGGTVAPGEGLNLILTPEAGYTVGSLTATARFTDHGHGNPTEMSFTFNGPTIPAAASLGETVTVDATDAFAPIPGHDGFTLVWNDEFNTPDGTHPDMVNNYETPARYNAAWNRFISKREDLMTMRNGAMAMYCKPNPEADRTAADDREMVSGAIQTYGKFMTKYGRFEARMKVYGHTGSFPAFWLMPAAQPNGWPMHGEIDVFESIDNTDKAFATLHTGKIGIKDGKEVNLDVITHMYQRECTINDWHTYAVEWDENEFRAYIDGQLINTITKSNIQDSIWPFDEQQFYLILNQSVGNGSWAKAPDESHTYQTDVDWVRVYQRDDLLAPTWSWADAEGNTLTEAPAELFIGTPVYIKVSTAATADYTLAADGIEVKVAPVEGKKGLFKLTPMAAGDASVAVTANYPAGVSAEAASAVALTGVKVVEPDAAFVTPSAGSGILTEKPADVEKEEDVPVFFKNATDTELPTLTFHHNSTLAEVTMPASVIEPQGKGEGSFVVVVEDETIAAAELADDLSSVKITRYSRLGSTLLTIVWRPAAAAPSMLRAVPAQGDITLAHLRVKVITPGSAVPVLSTPNPNIELEIGEETQAEVEVNPEGLDHAVNWESTDDAVATVDPNGQITAVGEGECSVKVTLEGTEAQPLLLSVNVKAKPEPPTPPTPDDGQDWTGIEAVNADAAAGRVEIFDLTGRRVTRIEGAGIYIVNGHRMLVK